MRLSHRGVCLVREKVACMLSFLQEAEVAHVPVRE